MTTGGWGRGVHGVVVIVWAAEGSRDAGRRGVEVRGRDEFLTYRGAGA